jgi:hypothetical protein
MNMGIHYLGENYGIDAVREYLTRYNKNVYHREIAAIKANGLPAIENKILDTYKKEKTEDAVDYFNKIISVDQSNTMAHEQLMSIYEHTDRFKYYV